MDVKQIQELVRIITRTNISEIEIEEKDFKIAIRQKTEAAAPQPAAYPVQAPLPSPFAVPAAPATAPAPPAKTDAPAKPAENLITIKSPMIGTFYRRSSPDKPAFVEVGAEVSPGKTVCIIEAMKLFNEIESEVSGTIVKVLVEDSSPVEFDQPLFLVEP